MVLSVGRRAWFTPTLYTTLYHVQAERERREAEEARANADEKMLCLEEGRTAEEQMNYEYAEKSYTRALELAEEDLGIYDAFTCECARYCDIHCSLLHVTHGAGAKCLLMQGSCTNIYRAAPKQGFE